jgi:hypothetical protein
MIDEPTVTGNLRVLADMLQCYRCGSLELDLHPGFVKCPACGQTTPADDGRLTFLGSKVNVDSSPPKLKGSGTKHAGIDFFDRNATGLTSSSRILEIGFGRGYFRRECSMRTVGTYVSSDILPHSNVDVVCDLTSQSVFRPESFDLVVMFNVLEHCFEFAALLTAARNVLRRERKLLITVPFISPVRQAPAGFFRYTPFALNRLAEECGFSVCAAEALTNPGRHSSTPVGVSWTGWGRAEVQRSGGK